MISHRAFGARSGDADLLEDRYADLRGVYAVDPADLTPPTTDPTAVPSAAHVEFSITGEESCLPQVVRDQILDATSSVEPVSDPLALTLDPALGSNGTTSISTLQRIADADGRLGHGFEITSTRIRSRAGDTSPVTPLTVPSLEEPPVKRDTQPRKKKTRTAKREVPAVGTKFKEDDKRDQLLERNRVAASKCRKKKKAWMTKLEEAKQNAERQRTQLRREYTALWNQVGQLKNILMSHSSCRDTYIDQWIQNEAQQFVERTNRRLERVGYGPSPPPSSGSHSLSALSAVGGNQGSTEVVFNWPSGANPCDLDTSNIKTEVADAVYEPMPLSTISAAMEDGTSNCLVAPIHAVDVTREFKIHPLEYRRRRRRCRQF